MQNAVFAIPDAGGEHSGKLLECCADAEAFERRQHDLGIAVAAEAMSFGREFQPQTGEIVDFAVECHDQTFIARQHRLMAGVGEVDNCKASMAESDAAIGVEPDALAVRSAMLERRSHRIDCRKMAGVRRAGEENAGDATHLVSSIAASVTPCGRALRPGTLRSQTRRPDGARTGEKR